MSMNIIIPYEGSGGFAIYLPAVIPNSYPLWNSATTYFPAPAGFTGLDTDRANFRVTRVSGVGTDYECLVTNTNVDPNTDTTGKWGKIGLTGTFKLIDQRVGVRHPGGLYVQMSPLNPKTAVTACAVFGLKDATQVRLKMTDPTAGTVYEQTRDLINTSAILDYFDYFFAPPVVRDACLFLNLPPYLNAKYEITATKENGTQPGMGGEIVLGYNYIIGTAMAGSGVDLVDYSTVETDTFGTTKLVPRQSVQKASYTYAMPYGTENSVQRILQRCLARPTVYHTGEDSPDRGTLIYGVLEGTPITLAGAGVSMATIDVKGLT